MTSHSSVQLTKNTLNIMRKIKTLLLVGLAFWYAADGFAQRGIGTNLPEKSSVLELKSGTRGLLIPRVALEQTTLAAPVTTPANSLLVYNLTKSTPTNDVRPGYYYWDQALNLGAGAWAALLSTNSAGKNISIAPDGTISIDPGTEAGKVLVTELVDPNDPNSEVTSEWVDIADILGQLLDIEGKNGILVTKDVDADGLPLFTVELGGDLTKETIINTAGNNFEIQSGGDNFYVSGLDTIEVDDEGNIDTTTDVFAATFDVLIVGNDGLVQKVNVADLLKKAVAVANGLHYDPVDGLIKLGGPLIEDTIIDLDGHDFTITTDGATANFQVAGLTETTSPATANQIMVVDADNNVRTVARVISGAVNNSLTIDSNWNAEYSPYVQEVNISVPTLGNDIDLTLPEATAGNEGQVINVRLTIDSEASNYLTIKDDAGADLTWGALPYQGWVLKSDGDKWLIVSAN